MTSQDIRKHSKGRGPALPVILALAAAVPLACHSSQEEPQSTAASRLAPPSLGTAASFLVLGGRTVTNTGPTTILGDLGVSPGTAITGFPPGLVLGGGATHAGDATALQAQSDVTAAYLVLAGDPCGFDQTGKDLGGLTLTKGVYCFSSEAQLTGKLVLDAEGDPGAVFVFQVGSKLTTASGASVAFVNGAQDCRVFWQIGSSATLGTDTVFAGSILALTSIALETGASVSGRALARNGAVTMDTNRIFAATCSSGSDAGADGTAAESGGSDAAVDVTAADSGGSDGTAVESGVDAGGPDVGSGPEGGPTLCCGGVLCGGSCVDPTTDLGNCGSCGHACAPDQACAGGACAPCSTVCGGACADLQGDIANCGSCGNACGAGQFCGGGACLPCSTVCAGVCTDLLGDVANCGSCGHSCAPSESCNGGACVTCPSLCGGACTDLTSDGVNCGTCGHSCAPGESCKGGSCVCQ